MIHIHEQQYRQHLETLSSLENHEQTQNGPHTQPMPSGESAAPVKKTVHSWYRFAVFQQCVFILCLLLWGAYWLNAHAADCLFWSMWQKIDYEYFLSINTNHEQHSSGTHDLWFIVPNETITSEDFHFICLCEYVEVEHHSSISCRKRWLKNDERG